MKRESYYAKGNRTGNLLHIETDGCIVNIRVGLTDADGYQVTRVDVIPDDERRSPDEDGRYWHTEDVDGNQLDGVVARVVRQPAKPDSDPRTAFSVGETVIIRDTSDDLDVLGDITAIQSTESGFQVSANVDVDGALHRVFLADARHLDGPRQRLEYLRSALRSEDISYGELAELQGLASHIEPGDVELLEAAGVPEHGEDSHA